MFAHVRRETCRPRRRASVATPVRTPPSSSHGSSIPACCETSHAASCGSRSAPPASADAAASRRPTAWRTSGCRHRAQPGAPARPSRPLEAAARTRVGHPPFAPCAPHVSPDGDPSDAPFEARVFPEQDADASVASASGNGGCLRNCSPRGRRGDFAGSSAIRASRVPAPSSNGRRLRAWRLIGAGADRSITVSGCTVRHARHFSDALGARVQLLRQRHPLHSASA